ncbi:uncharacterized protein B0J16DRAFT_324626 [Fusarium flagelliforme]|uniref:uncharacterized protein n=1 Tax=Fusarium flagelliforme TaxID=2675880 RepID=UPI001E8D97C5|nr:uncharacterized protein B0J16DRAFT_324626 [Fusarium flagelliforme]KAH7173120.1 hypothetical protein B0J16DRAFT_324626 [Fusarium flagelliforme]
MLFSKLLGCGRTSNFLASFETNVFGLIRVTRALLSHLRHRKTGTMVFISSLSGWIGHQFTGAYAGSKFALEGVVESLHHKTKSLGLRTLLIEPGRFRTHLLSDRNLYFKQSQISDYEVASAAHGSHLHGSDLRQPGDPLLINQLIVRKSRKKRSHEFPG